MADGGPWRGAKIPPYQTLCGAIIMDYSGKPRNIERYLPLRRAQKPPRIFAIAAHLQIFDNTESH